MRARSARLPLSSLSFCLVAWSVALGCSGDPTTPTFPGDLLNLNTAGVTNLALTATNGPTGTAGSYTFGNRQPVNFLTLEAVNRRPLGSTT